MIDYDTFTDIKHLYKNKKYGINQIARELALDYKTVKTWVNRESFIKKAPIRKGTVLLPYVKRIHDLLDYNGMYTAVQILRILKEDGYKGSYSALSHYIASIRVPKKTPYFTLTFEPGEAAQVDFANCGTIQMSYGKRRFYAFIMVLCYSRMIYVEFIFRQGQEHFHQCHRNAFEYFKGVPEKIMVDNCKVAVIKHSRHGVVKFNIAYSDFSSHYGFNITPCNVQSPNEKGQVEKAVDYLKRNFLSGLDQITSLSALNNAVRYWMENTANIRKHKTTLKRPIDLFKAEKMKLIPVNLHPYDCCVRKTVRSNSQFRVNFEANKYSVPSEFCSTSLTAKIYTDKLAFYYNNNLIAAHDRSYDKNQDFEKSDHLKKIIEMKKNARDQKLLKSFFLISSKAEEYYNGIKSRFQPKEHIRKIMALSEIYGREKVAAAIEDALEFKAFSSEYIANILEQKKRFKEEPAPLHVLRNKDYLDIELNEPNINFYDNLMKGLGENDGSNTNR